MNASHLSPTRRGLLLAGATVLLPGAARSQVTLPPLPMRERVLANGLRLVALPLAGAGTASIQVWYRVGSKDDPANRSGFAHLFEHLMFKHTQFLPDEAFDRLTEDVGGSNNAFTASDVTVFQDEVPANHLERLLWAEAERMAHLQVEQGSFASERDVVKEEYRQGVLAGPYGRFFNALPALAYSRHPYRRPTIGNIAELDAATLDDVRRFHTTYYRPDNAVLIVAGGFDPADLDKWVDRYFGPLVRPATPIPRVSVTEPRRTAARRTAVYGPTVPLPAVAILWKGPRADATDGPALQVASALLAGGESSRLNEALVYRAQTAQSAGFYADLNTDAGMLAAYAIAAGGKKLAVVEADLLREIRRLATQPIAGSEIDKVRTQLLTAAVTGRQTPAGQADAAGWALINHGDVRHADRELALLQAVTAADVQRVLKTWVLGRPAVTAHYTQRSGT